MTVHVLVLGAGGIGGLLAARLSHNPDLDVSVAVRRETGPLRFTVGGEELHPQVRIVRGPEGHPEVDWVVVATKVYDVPGLAPWLKSSACRSARIAVAQNGVEQVDRITPYAQAERVMPMIVTYGAERREPGSVVQTLEGKLRLPSGEAGAAFATLAAPTELTVELVDDFVTALWTKLAWNLVGNSLSTLTDLPVRELGTRPELRLMAARLVEECSAVAQLEGAHLDPGLATEMLDAFAEYAETVHSSMWQDRHAARAFEHDAISGAVVRAAERHGRTAPYSLMATMLLETLSSLTASPTYDHAP